MPDAKENEAVKKAKELANKRFAREELGDLLRLFSSLGLTVCLGILGCFLLGIWADGKLNAMGWQTRNLGRIIGLLIGLGMSLYWAYLRIKRHLDKYDPKHDAKK